MLEQFEHLHDQQNAPQQFSTGKNCPQHKDSENLYVFYMRALVLGKQLYRLISGSGTADIAIQCLSLAGIPLGHRYALFGLYPTRDEDEHTDDGKEDIRRDKRVSLAYFYLDNVLQDLLFCNHTGIIAPIGEYYFILTELKPEEQAADLTDIIDRVLQLYKNEFRLTLIVAKAEDGQNLADLEKMAQDAHGRLEYYRFWGSKRAQRPDSDFNVKTDGYFKFFRNFVNRIDLQDYEGALSIMDLIFDQCLHRGKENLEMAKFRAHAIISVLLSAVDIYANRDETVQMEEHLYKLDNILSLRREAERVLRSLDSCQKAEGSRSGGARYMERIQAYIDDNYSDSDLSVNSLAEQFALHPAYLSRAFKSALHCGVLEYIQERRVAEAKQLLYTQSIKSVAQKVGFWDTQALIRVFKKREGITPGEYKKVIEAKERASNI